MQGYWFTDDLRSLLASAREEASRWNHEYVGTEHILLAYTLPENGTGTRLLEQVGASPQSVRQVMDGVVKRGIGKAAVRDALPYTSRAKKTLELAMSEARDLGHSFVGIQHLLLGVLREEKGIGAQVLADQGVTTESIRAVLLEAHPAGQVVDRSTQRATDTHFERPSLLHVAVPVLSLLWIALWAYLRRDTIDAAAMTTFAIMLGPPGLLWFLGRRRR